MMMHTIGGLKKNALGWTALSATTIAVIGFTISCSRNNGPEASGAADDMNSSNVATPVAGREGTPSGEGSAPATGPQMTFQRPPLTDVLSIVSNTNPTSLLTQSVHLSGVKVQRVLDPRYLLVGPDEQHTVVVRLKETLPGLETGNSIDVSGIISQLGEDLTQWSVKPGEKSLLAQHAIFINATKEKIVR